MSKYALISVSNKTDINVIANILLKNNYTILSTGGTYNALKELDPESQNIIEVSDYTGFPEILGGRVKTLHPKIHGGLLARKDQETELQELSIERIHVVVCNLYPFEKFQNYDEATALENIDIGGVTLLRAAAKNYQNVITLCDPADYNIDLQGVDRRQLAAKAFSHVAEYDISIAKYFGDQTVRKYKPLQKLKYGCNPHQETAMLCGEKNLEILNGSVGYINILDALLGYQLVCEAETALNTPVAASYKHTSPAGVGAGYPLTDTERRVFGCYDDLSATATAFVRARNCDPVSSFGDFISISSTVDEITAKQIKREVSDGIIAPDYTPEALNILSQKKSGNYVILKMPPPEIENQLEYREICGMALGQSRNVATTGLSDIDNVVTRSGISETAKKDLVLANITLKYTQSNSVAFAFNGQVIGIGAGQQNRVDCVRIAGKKANRWVARFSDEVIDYASTLSGTRSEKNNILHTFIDNFKMGVSKFPLSLASDAFFPFSDSIEVAGEFGVKYILQPGGSVADGVCIDKCNELSIGMAMSGKRMFLH